MIRLPLSSEAMTASSLVGVVGPRKGGVEPADVIDPLVLLLPLGFSLFPTIPPTVVPTAQSRIVIPPGIFHL